MLAASLVATGCGSTSTGDSSTELRVFAAAGLSEAFTELGEQFSAAHPGVDVTFNFAGAPTLDTQIEQGAALDVFAIADTANMERVADLMETSHVFARNKMAIVVAPGNPKGIDDLQDLCDKDLKVVLGDPTLPAGKCADKILSRLHLDVQPVSLEDNVKSIVTKVALGEADAGLAWESEIAARDGDVAGVSIPDKDNVIELFPIAVAKNAEHAAEAQAFADFVRSDAGQDVLVAHGFMAPQEEE